MVNVLLTAIGFVSGIISGMGIGGGAVLIPALAILFQTPQQQAQYVNLLYFIPTAAVALVTHVKEGNIEKTAVSRLTLCGLLTAVLGSLLAVRMDASVLRRVFGFFLLAMGTAEFFKRDDNT